MANTSKQQILTLHTTHGEQYNAATEQQENIIGQRLAWARNQAGISLAKFSTLLEEYGVNVGAGAIHKWELGKSVPSAYQLIAAAKALQLEDNLSQFTIPVLTPYFFASSDLASTIPCRSSVAPQTATAFPLREGSSIISTEA